MAAADPSPTGFEAAMPLNSPTGSGEQDSAVPLENSPVLPPFRNDTPHQPDLGIGYHYGPRVHSPPPALPLAERHEPPGTWDSLRRQTSLVVDVAWHNFEHFKNRYSPTDGLAIIEVLRGHHNIADEVIWEERLRSKSRRRREAGPTASSADADDCWIQRVRIQSPQLLTILSLITGYHDIWATDKPRVFFPPFRALYYFLPQMRECCKILEEKCRPRDTTTHPALNSIHAQGDEGDAASDDSSSFSSGVSDDGLDEPANPMDPAVAIFGDQIDPPTALSHVKKYITFVEEHIVPQWNHAAGINKPKIRFNDLWMSFKPGELLYVPSESDSPDNASGKRRVKRNITQSAWRLYSMVLSSVKDDTPNDIHLERKERKESKRCLDLHCYYIDYDGTSYVPVRNMFCISDYEGERDITTFPFYPMRFVKDANKIIADLAKDGAWFCEAVKRKHLRYDGWTLPYGPSAESGANSHVEPRDPQPLVAAPVEHVDGDVMIDFAEGFKSEPALGPDPSSWSVGLRDFTDSDWPVGDDNIYIKHWEKSASGQFSYVGDVKEKTQRGEWYCEKMATEHLNSRPMLKAHKLGNIVDELDEDDLVLLPRRIVGYTFRERKFVMLDVRYLKPLPTSQNAFRDLKIDEQHKKMIKSLVKTHLRKQEGQRHRHVVSDGQDLIRGKGAGLFILLHGVPGVGKTATAEAVAQASGKPLFPITCGDLGVSPQEVDAALTSIFRLANLWDCVLLLDEADVFLSRRELGDLERNALVSVFLRVLEYYNGILFLTTNRVGTLDEAFKSRIHLSLYYPPLTLQQTIAIFKVNIRRLREVDAENRSTPTSPHLVSPNPARLIIDEESILRYAQWYFEVNDLQDTPEQQWNGRQIRNAFQIAYSLAHFDMEKTSIDEWEDDEDDLDHVQPSKILRLDYKQFEMVASAIERFEDYLYEATGGTDKDKAAAKHTRADDFDHHQWQQKNVYRAQAAARQRVRPKYIPPEQRGSGNATVTGPFSTQTQTQSRRPQYQPQPQPQRRGNNSPALTRHASQQAPQVRGHQRHLSVPESGSMLSPGPASTSGRRSPAGRPISPHQRTSPARATHPRHYNHSSPAAAGQPSPRTSSGGGTGKARAPVGPSPRAGSMSGYSGYSGWSGTSPRTPGFVGGQQFERGEDDLPGDAVDGEGVYQDGFCENEHDDYVYGEEGEGEGEGGLYEQGVCGREGEEGYFEEVDEHVVGGR